MLPEEIEPYHCSHGGGMSNF